MGPEPSTPADDEVRDYVLESIADFVELDVYEIDADADIFRTYGIDSLQIVELVTGLERHFELAEIELDEFRKTRSAHDIAVRVDAMRGGGIG